jgi:isoleucyl-tRNA synthetase
MSNHTLNDVEEGKDYSFPLQEEAILQLWEETDAFHQQLKLSEGRPEYVTSLFSRIL